MGAQGELWRSRRDQRSSEGSPSDLRQLSARGEGFSIDMGACRVHEPAPFIEILDSRPDMQEQQLAASIRTHLRPSPMARLPGC